MARGADEIECARIIGRGDDAHAAEHAGIGAAIGIGFLLEDGARIDALDRAAIFDVGTLHDQGNGAHRAIVPGRQP